jgi:DNA-directed RNA polymerase I subunit RPA43
MDIDMPPPAKPSKSSDNIYQPPDIPANPQFPFFTQTVSLYEPLFPIGWAQPVTNCQFQHLQHLQNKYVPSLRGVLLDYKNVSFGENPGRNGAATDDETPTTVMAKGEAAVGWGWITAEVDLFVPSRGAWMEGSVNLQTEGHIGVVCFGKFNASIEARRLPPDWKWVPNESPEAQGFEETASVITADDHGVVRQIHSTGFWADGNGDKVKGKIRFRIRNFDVGTSGEISYLSLEGTMLDRAGEKAVVAEEAETAKMRQGKRGGGQRVRRRHIPEFAMTRFAVDEQEQTQDNEEEKREVLALPEDQ